MNSKSYTLGSFIADVRSILRDSNSTAYHWTDATILAGVCDALAFLGSVRPTTRYGENGTLREYDFPSGETQLKAYSAWIPENCRVGVVYYAAARCFEPDVTDTVNLQLAATLKQQAEAVFRQ